VTRAGVRAEPKISSTARSPCLHPDSDWPLPPGEQESELESPSQLECPFGRLLVWTLRMGALRRLEISNSSVVNRAVQLSGACGWK
jgi:hypothetical protein